MHASGHHHVRFLQSNGQGDFQFSAGRARSNAIESSCLIMQPNKMKAQNFHLYFTVLSPHFSMTKTNCTRHQLSPKYRHLQLDQQLVNSVFGYRRNAWVALGTKLMQWMAQLRGQRNPGRVKSSLTAHNHHLTNARLVPASKLSQDRLIAS